MSEQEGTGKLALKTVEMEIEFLYATYQAIEENDDEFSFHGYTVETNAAIDVVLAINASRTYH